MHFSLTFVRWMVSFMCCVSTVIALSARQLMTCLRLGIFEEAEVVHVEGTVDPIRDLEIIADELILKDIETVTKMKEKLEKELGNSKKDKKKLQDLVGVCVSSRQFCDRCRCRCRCHCNCNCVLALFLSARCSLAAVWCVVTLQYSRVPNSFHFTGSC